MQQGADADKSVLGSSAPVRRPPAHRGLTRFVNPHPTQRQRRHTRLTSVAEAHVVGKRCALHHRRCELLRWPCGAFLVRSAGGGRPPNQLTLPPNPRGRAARTRTRPCSGVLAACRSACTGPTQFGARERENTEHGRAQCSGPWTRPGRTSSTIESLVAGTDGKQQRKWEDLAAQLCITLQHVAWSMSGTMAAAHTSSMCGTFYSRWWVMRRSSGTH